jgi:hypothetical protein
MEVLSIVLVIYVLSRIPAPTWEDHEGWAKRERKNR